MTTDIESIRSFLTELNRSVQAVAPSSEHDIRAADALDADKRRAVERGDVLCPLCGLNLPGDTLICTHHHASMNLEDFGWGRGNRIWCDFFHRGEGRL